MNRIKSSIKPEKVESLGNGYYYYNYDIQSEQETVPINESETQEITMYNYVQIRLHGKPNYDRCSEAIIRQYISDSDEFKLINKYNSYQLGVSDYIPSEYQEYLQVLDEIKSKIRQDFDEPEISSSTKSMPRQADVFSLLNMTINTMSLTDQQSLSVKSLYPNWEDLIGQTLSVGTKLQYGDKLFKVVQQHTAQKEWVPGIDTASLYTEIVEDHEGTLEDPIPYPEDGNMVIYNGKYYIENGIIYQCIRDSGIPLYTALANVVDNYVKVVETLA